MYYCTRTSASYNSASGRPRHLKVTVLTILQTDMGAQWLSGRVLDSRPKGPRVLASPASLRCVFEQEH